jgi:hypothetical protein
LIQFVVTLDSSGRQKINLQIVIGSTHRKGAKAQSDQITTAYDPLLVASSAKVTPGVVICMGFVFTLALPT